MTKEDKIQTLQDFATRQLFDVILPWWQKYMSDEVNGGFLGSRDHLNQPVTGHPKGLILNARILWAFSAAYAYKKDEVYRQTAERAYRYLLSQFKDPDYPGYFWSLNPDGSLHNGKKQTYAQAFVMYGMSEYAAATGSEQALNEALSLFNLIEEMAFDPVRNGYLEAFSREWNDIGDLRLSDIDMNEKKTMNTHLHVIEAYSRLYRLHKDERLKQSIENLLGIFSEHFINNETHHLNLFFDDYWTLKSGDISYGHDIEASWLLQEAAESVENEDYIKKFRTIAIQLAEAVQPALLPEGGLIHENHAEMEKNTNQLEWWAQAEAIVGFLNVFQLTGDEYYLEKSLHLIDYVETYFVDKNNGEWYYRVERSGEPVTSYEKAGFWKCPYHTVRMGLEVLERS